MVTRIGSELKAMRFLML